MSSTSSLLLMSRRGGMMRVRANMLSRPRCTAYRSVHTSSVPTPKPPKRSRFALFASVAAVGAAALCGLASEVTTAHTAAASDNINRSSGMNRNAIAARICAAAARGDLADVEAAAKVKSMDDIMNIRHPYGWTPLMAAAANGHGHVVDWLIANGANVNDADAYRGGRPLNERARREFHPGINPRISCAQWTPLHYAVAFNHLDIANSLLKNGADPDAKNAEGETPDTCIQWDVLGEDGKSINEKLKAIFKEVRHQRSEERKLREKEERIRFPLEAKLRSMMVGQIMPIFSVASAIRRRDNGWFDENKPLVLMFLGSSGVGKCFAKDTHILMADGTIRAVQSINAGDQVMGDDCTPRTVTRDSVVRGRGELFKVTPNYNAEPFICNGEHVLVVNVARDATVIVHPSKPAFYSIRSRRITMTGSIRYDVDGEYNSLTKCNRAAELLNDNPLLVQISVVDYLKSSELHSLHPTMYRPSELIYPDERQGTSSVRRVAEQVFGCVLVDDQVAEIAWLIGIWITNGHYDINGHVTLGGHFINARCAKTAKLFTPELAYDEPDRVGKNGAVHPQIIFHTDQRLKRLIEQLQVNDDGVIPQSILTDDRAVRSAVLKGMLDGSPLTANGEHILAAATIDILHQYQRLVWSLGRQCHPVTSQSSKHCHQQCIAVDKIMDKHEVPMSAGSVSGCNTTSNLRSFEFTVRSVGTGDYYGFAVDGNHRFLLADMTVSHNTMLSKELAKHIVKDQDNGFIRIDCTEYQSKHEMARLIGSPPGYVGYEEGGQLTTKLDKCPDAVVLLDEVEKAHPDVLTLMLQVFDEGRLTDGKGKTIHCPNAIFIMTSNLVQEEIRTAIESGDYGLRPSTVLEQRKRDKSYDSNINAVDIPETHAVIVPVPKISDVVSSDYDEGPPEPTDEVTISICAKQTDSFLRRIVYPILKRHFRREEFLGRINDYVVFHHLSQSDLRATVKMELSRWKKKAFDRHHIDIVYSDRIIESLKSGYDERYGYRSIIYAVEKRLVNVLAAAHERDLIKPGCQVEIDVEDDEKGERAGRVYIKSVKENAVKERQDNDKNTGGRFFGLF